MFNKFSNPESFMAGYKDKLQEAAGTPITSTAAGTDSSVKPMNSVPSTTKTSMSQPTKSTPSTPNKSAVTEVALNDLNEETYNELMKPIGETNVVHQKRMNGILFEHMDLSDYTTIKEFYSLNEAEQNTFLLSLTNKLYQMIVGKIDDVDFGDIPNSKGNIRKYSKYKQLRECVEVLEQIFEQYKEDTKPIQVLDNALSNLENNVDIFVSGYANDISLVKMTYETTGLAVIQGIGFMIATCIEYVKTPKKEGLSIILNKTGLRKVKDHLVYENLIKFNDACSKGDLDKALRPLISNKVKNFDITAIAFGARVVVAVGVVVAAIIPFLRQLVYFFYSSRVRMSTYLDAQADLLEMNSTELRGNDTIQTVGDKNRVINRQLKIAKLFHAISNKINIDSKESEIQATKELKEDSKKYKMDEINSNPAIDGPLF